jgi:hypothetical protein
MLSAKQIDLTNLRDVLDYIDLAFYPELCTSDTEKGNFIFNIGLLYFTNVFRSFTQKVKLIFDMFFRHLNPQGVADFTEFALLSGT